MTDYTLTVGAAAFVVASRGNTGTYSGSPQPIYGRLGVVVEAASFAMSGPPVAFMYSGNPPAFFLDGVAEWSATLGTTRPYVLGGAKPGFLPAAGNVPDGRLGYWVIEDGVRHEQIRGRFVAPDRLLTIEIIGSSNAGAAVNWPAGRRSVRLVPAAAAYLGGLAEDMVWTAVELGVTPDFGDLSDLSGDGMDLGELTGIGDFASDTIASFDLGEDDF